VQSVYVREDARRKGVFRALYRDVQRRAAADPTVIGLRLYVERENVRAQQSYHSLGMLEIGYNLMQEYPLPGRPNDIS
jgi:ribosomal protein S18 acetylase RimI-like enzyme